MLTLPRAHQCRLNSICPYFTRFPLAFPFSQLAKTNPQKVFDPFCGGGTTLLAARLLGCQAYGMDSNLLAAVISRAKLSSPLPASLTNHAAIILAQANHDEIPPAGEFWHLCFSPPVLRDLLAFRSHFKTSLISELDAALCATIAGLLHGPGNSTLGAYLSNEMPSSFSPASQLLTDYWAKHGNSPPEINVLDAIARRACYLFADCPPPVPGQIRLGDNRSPECYSPFRDIDCIFCSPPYYGLDAYYSSQWLRMWLLGMQEETPGRLDQDDPACYTRDLAVVWRNCAAISRPGTRLILRLGKISEHHSPDPIQLLTASLAQSEADWVLDGYERVPTVSPKTSRIFPFPLPAERPPVEYDFWAHLKT